MRSSHFLGQWNELIELTAVGVVVARQDVVDDVAVGGVLPEFVINHERGVLYGSIVNENKNATVLTLLYCSYHLRLAALPHSYFYPL